MIELLLLPLLAGLLIALAAGPLGCFVVWNRMAYFSDTLAHSALLGISFALLLSLPLNIGIVGVCFLVAAALLLLDGQSKLPRDTLLGIFAHGALAGGIVLSSFIEGMRLDLMAFLFGDILAVGVSSLIIIFVVCTLVLAALMVFWRPLLLISINLELAQVEGLNTRLYRSLLIFLLATLIAFSIKIIGVLLIGALLVIPAASARGFSRSPASMALLATAFALMAVLGGFALSWFSNAAAGPAIVLVSFAIFVVASSLQRLNPNPV